MPKQDSVKKTESPIIFPIFSECSQWTIDPYWKEIFDQCAQGRLPKGVKINRYNTITTPGGAHIQLMDDSKEVFKIMLKIFKEDMGLGSEDDMSKKKLISDRLRETLKSSYSGTWKQIKLKNAKLFFLLDFVIRSSKENGLTKPQSKRLMSDIRLGMFFGTISPDDIEYVDGKVRSINGLTFGDGYYEFERSIYSKPCAKKSIKDTKKDRIDLFEEYLAKYHTSVISFE